MTFLGYTYGIVEEYDPVHSRHHLFGYSSKVSDERLMVQLGASEWGRGYFSEGVNVVVVVGKRRVVLKFIRRVCAKGERTFWWDWRWRSEWLSPQGPYLRYKRLTELAWILTIQTALFVSMSGELINTQREWCCVGQRKWCQPSQGQPTLLSVNSR